MVDATVPERLFARHLDLTRLRGRRRGLVRCIFHNDPSPSLSLDLDRGLFYCFGCGVQGGMRRFAELIGESIERAHPRATSRPHTVVDEARAWALAEARRQQKRLAPYRDLFAVVDFIRQRLRVADQVRHLATALGPTEPVLDALALAAHVEGEAYCMEAAVDEILAEGRIA